MMVDDGFMSDLFASYILIIYNYHFRKNYILCNIYCMRGKENLKDTYNEIDN